MYCDKPQSVSQIWATQKVGEDMENHTTPWWDTHQPTHPNTTIQNIQLHPHNPPLLPSTSGVLAASGFTSGAFSGCLPGAFSGCMPAA